MEVSSILRGMTRDGSARILVINSRKIVDDAIRVHSCAPSAAAALGRALTAVSMIGCMSGEKEDTVTLGFNGDGQGGRIIVVGNYYGDVKGYIENPAADPPKKNGMHRPKNKASVTSSDGYRQRADNPNPSTDPTTEKDSFNIENNTAGQFPCLAGLHTFLTVKHPARF